MKQFKHKPTVIEAIQYIKNELSDDPEWVKQYLCTKDNHNKGVCIIIPKTRDQNILLRDTQWAIYDGEHVSMMTDNKLKKYYEGVDDH
mgnify:CR=1 FL=1